MMSPSHAEPQELDSKVPHAARTLNAYLGYLAQSNKVEAIAHLKIMIDASPAYSLKLALFSTCGKILLPGRAYPLRLLHRDLIFDLLV